MPAEKIDLYKVHKEEYKASSHPRILELPPIRYLTIVGHGSPADDVFTEKLGALYGMAYTLKFIHKDRGQDFVVAKLEGMWKPVGGFEQKIENPSEMIWDYKLLMRMPDFVVSSNLNVARKQLAKKKKVGPFTELHVVPIEEGTVVQALHIGPYADETATIDKMHSFAKEQGYKPLHGHHELYLSDPRKVAPEKLRTILRTPVEKV
jgi:hypothetical protein